jgi:alcohol dehydrogenase class IV
MHLIPAFGNHLPVKVRFGEGVATSLPDVLSELDATRVFLMVDDGIERFNPAAAALLGSLGELSNLNITRFDKPPVEPTMAMVDAATQALARSEATVLVAIGGGSVIDTAKAARLRRVPGPTARLPRAGRGPGSCADQCRHRV